MQPRVFDSREDNVFGLRAPPFCVDLPESARCTRDSALPGLPRGLIERHQLRLDLLRRLALSPIGTAKIRRERNEKRS